MSTTMHQSTQSFIETEVSRNQIVVFAKSWCPHCDRTKMLFNGPQFKQYQPKYYDLDHMKEGAAIQTELARMTGQRTVPSVWVNGTFVGGNSETQQAFRNGTLTTSLMQASQ